MISSVSQQLYAGGIGCEGRNGSNFNMTFYLNGKFIVKIGAFVLGPVMKLSAKTILITGAADGLGAALAMCCAAQGADLILLDKNRRLLGDLSDRIVNLGYSAPGLYPMDLATVGIDDFKTLVSVVMSETGSLDALIHCAVHFEGLQPLEMVDPQNWLESMQVNVNAPWMLSCACLPLLKKSPAGRLFFMLDDLEMVAGAYWGSYGTAKAALAGLVKQFDQVLSNTTIAVRGIDPGVMRTAFRARAYHAESPLDQPEPDIAAGKITALLSDELTDQQVIISLA